MLSRITWPGAEGPAGRAGPAALARLVTLAVHMAASRRGGVVLRAASLLRRDLQSASILCGLWLPRNWARRLVPSRHVVAPGGMSGPASSRPVAVRAPG